MAQVINTNMASLNAQRNLNKSQGDYNQSLQRLSSGLRINSAKDDAAGLAISTRFTSQIKGLNVAVRNAGDGIALAQTAEGALGSMNDNLQRIRELAVQSANATNSDVDREALQAEVEQLVAEISRTASETDFNGRKLLDGSFKATFQIGANAGQTVDIGIAELTADKLGSSMKAGVSAQGTDKKLSNGDLVINGENIRSSIADDDALSYTNKESSGIAKAAAINESSALTGVTATVDENVVLGSKIANGTATNAVSGTIKLNGVEIALQGTDNTNDIAKAGTRNSVVAAINAKSGQTGVVAEDGGANGGVILRAADGRNITIESNEVDLTKFGLADNDTEAATASTSYAGFTLTAANANTPINISGGNGTGNGDLANAGLKAGNYKAQTAATTSTGTTAKSEVGEMLKAISKEVTGLKPASHADYGDIGDITPGGTHTTLNAAIGTLLGAGGVGEYVADLATAGVDSPLVGTYAQNFATYDVTDATTKASSITAANTELAKLATHLGLDSSKYSFASGDLTSDDLAGYLGAIGSQVNSMVADFEAANSFTSALALDATKLKAELEKMGVPAANSGVAITADLEDLHGALSNIPGITAADDIPASWASGGAEKDVVLTTYGLNKLAEGLASVKMAIADGSSSQGEAAKRALQDGDLVINGVTIGASSALDDTASNTTALSSDGAASAIAIAAAINKSYDSTGVTATVNATEFVGGAATGTVTESSKGSSLTFTLNGVDISLIDQGDYEKNKAAAISAINERAGETGVTAKDNGVSLTLTAADGRNISMYAESAAAPNAATAGAEGSLETKAANFGLTGLDTTTSGSGASVDAKIGAVTVYGTVTLTSSKAFEVSYGTGGSEGLADSGLVAGKFGGGEDGQALTEIDISSFEGAQKAIVAVDNAIAQVASQRADLGAIQNRMESTVSNLEVTAENLNAANSRIMDADFAAETAEMSRSQVLQQAGISVLAQANASTQNVLSLLG